ncbi:MAG: glycosyltransferase [Anaerolineae bacterium]|nr:glycosyltransferase [Anaerolineae bacterium]
MEADRQPLLSIITPVYNGEAYLEKLILSLLNQWDDDIEHLIIDDGSTDGTPALLQKFPHLRVRSRENRGQYASMNEGLQLASGRYICFISADDLIAPGAIGRVKDCLKVNNYPPAVYGKTHVMDENERDYPVQPAVRQGSLTTLKYFSHITHCALYIQKEFLFQHGLYFDASYTCAGDYDWLVRILQTGIKPVYIPFDLAKIRVHSQQTSTRQEIRALQEQKKTHQKYGVNQFLFDLIRQALTLRSALLRLIDAGRVNGLSGFLRLFFYFIRHKTTDFLTFIKRA